MSSIIRKFDFGQSGIQAISFLLYCAEVLAALPFGLPDEPLYVVYTINRVLQVRGGELEANMKASINDGALGVVAKHVQEIMAAEKEREGDAAYDLNATAQEPESNFNMEMVEDTQGIPDDVLDKLRVRLHLFLSGFFFPYVHDSPGPYSQGFLFQLYAAV
jgi:hypothetical protein